jgi:hypothetical protein
VRFFPPTDFQLCDGHELGVLGVVLGAFTR